MPAKITGLVAATPTPLHADGSLNLDAVEPMAALLARQGVAGVFVAGSTGECHSLTVEERLALTEAWAPAAKEHRLKFMVHVGHNCQLDACRLAAHAAEHGVDVVSCTAPTYFKPPAVRQLVEFCTPIAAAAGKTPFYYYHIPMLTGVALSMPEFLRLGSPEMPNLAGMKFTYNDLMQLQECLRLDDGKYDVLFGHDEMLLAALALGARGAVGTTYCFAASIYLEVIDRFAAGDFEAARAAQARSVRMIRAFAEFGFLAATKQAMTQLGVACGPVRAPLPNMSDEQVNAFRACFAEYQA
ncbi:MAG: dihydrodipicolinate synthase family protein [Pirellulaceae bacterium]